MKTIPTTLVHRVLMPEDHAGGPHPLLILLHGRGADEEDLLGLAPMLDPRLILISVRAPLPFEGGGYTWYSLAGPVGQPDPESYHASARALGQCAQDIAAGYPVDPARVFLLGFSMGAVMALTLALAHPLMFRGIAAHSGYLPDEAIVHRTGTVGPHLFMAHGTADPVIPITMARQARQRLEQAGARLTYREYPMGHEISDRSLADILMWMRGLLDTTHSDRTV